MPAAPAKDADTAPSRLNDDEETGEDAENTEEEHHKAPSVGTEVFYRLPLYGMWVPATVVDREQNGVIYEPPLEDHLVHLELKLDRKKHQSSVTRAYRMNVEPGTGLRQYSLHKPRNADEEVKKAQQQEAMRTEIRRENMRNL